MQELKKIDGMNETLGIFAEFIKDNSEETVTGNMMIMNISPTDDFELLVVIAETTGDVADVETETGVIVEWKAGLTEN